MGTIRDIGIKIKALWGRVQENLFLVLIILLVAFLAFGLGRLSVLYAGKGEFRVIYPDGQQASVLNSFLGLGGVSAEPSRISLPQPPEVAGEYVGSRTGSTYFFPWCPLAVKIPPSNRVYFKSREAAEAAGYHRGRCNGL